MSISSAFSTDKKFYGESHFPYGISRSGEFIKEQAILLETYGVAYQELHSGQRQPVNSEEQDFVSVCKGEKQAQTKHEIAWMRYCQKIQERITIPALINSPVKGRHSPSTLVEEK